MSEGSPSIRHLKRARDENEETAVEEMSQTQEDSQGLLSSLRRPHRPSMTRAVDLLALSSWRPSTPSQRERMRRVSVSSCPPTPHRSPGLHSPPPTKRLRRSAEHVSGSISAPPQAISRYKRERNDASLALNAEFEINLAANAGVPFAFDEVVRGRRHRHGLNAGECEECRGVSIPLLSFVTISFSSFAS